MLNLSVHEVTNRLWKVESVINVLGSNSAKYSSEIDSVVCDTKFIIIIIIIIIIETCNIILIAT